jgi:hypothetical protein
VELREQFNFQFFLIFVGDSQYTKGHPRTSNEHIRFLVFGNFTGVADPAMKFDFKVPFNLGKFSQLFFFPNSVHPLTPRILHQVVEEIFFGAPFSLFNVIALVFASFLVVMYFLIPHFSNFLKQKSK